MSRAPFALAVTVAALAFAGCGEEIDVPDGETAFLQGETVDVREGAELFRERCSGCHTIDAAASRGSKPEGQVSGGERTNGPNFNTRKVKADDALFAIRNGGFSGAIMPANIVVGSEALAVAAFLERYSGGKSVEGNEQSSQDSGSTGGPE